MSQIILQVKQLIASGQFDMAEKLLEIELKHPSAPAIMHGLYAQCLVKQKRKKKAMTYLRKQINSNKRDAPQLSADLAGIYLQAQQFENAEKYFNQALKHAPNSEQLWHLMGIAQYQLGKMEQAYESFAKAEHHDSFKPILVEAEKAMEDNDLNKCKTLVNNVLGKFPAHPQASFMLASLLLKNGHLEKAAEHIQKAVNYAPCHQNLWNMLAQIQIQLCQFEAALTSAEKLVYLNPTNEKHALLLADILQNTGKMDLAIKSYKKAMELGADASFCQLQMAHIQQNLGNHQEAIVNYRDCLAQPEYVGSAFWGLHTQSQYEPTEQETARLKAIQLDPDLSLEQACQASFSLARSLEKEGQYQKAFHQYSNANKLKPGISYVPPKAEQKFASIKDVFNNDLLATSSNLNTGKAGATPIFIVGLPRTGSTLTEQILASHSQVEATMELKVLPAIARLAYLQSSKKQGNNKGDISCLSDIELAQFGQYYIQLTEAFRNDAPYFIDKLPPNFQHIGLIRKILPHAIIIETQRQPMAWGLAVFRQYFAQGHDFSYDLEHIAHAYNNYMDLMSHWHDCVPESICTIDYDKLVMDKETHIRALLSHCGLPFEASCLEPHLHQRYVRTASSDQIRQPIYQTAVDSWKKYQSDLTPLKEALASYK